MNTSAGAATIANDPTVSADADRGGNDGFLINGSVNNGAASPFAQLAASGLALVVGLQAFINMGVSLSILPAKGMTLPLISYGGSSLFAVALTLGFALGLTRHRPVLPDEATR